MNKLAAITDEELIQKCKKSDVKYFEKLYKKYYAYAMGVSVRYLSDSEDALEVVNDAFIKVFGSIGSLNPDGNLKAWIRKIVVNTAIDQRRKNLRQVKQTDLEEAYYVGLKSEYIEELEAQEIRHLINALPSLQKTVFNLYEIDGYSHEEISSILGIAVSSSRVYLSRSKEKLRQAWNIHQLNFFQPALY